MDYWLQPTKHSAYKGKGNKEGYLSKLIYPILHWRKEDDQVMVYLGGDFARPGGRFDSYARALI